MDRDYLKEKKILLVDDGQELLDMVCSILKEEGYQNLCTASCMKEAMEKAAVFSPELAVLDVMLPDGSGFELFEKLKQMGDFPVLFLTACGEDEDKFRGLGLGADDYMVKPFNPKELVARIRTRLRPVLPDDGRSLRIGDLTIDVSAHEVQRGDELLSLTPLEFELLVALASKPNQVFTREQLLEQVWGYQYKADTRLVNVHVQRLRSKVERDPDNPKVVMTVRGVGYRAGATT